MEWFTDGGRGEGGSSRDNSWAHSLHFRLLCRRRGFRGGPCGTRDLGTTGANCFHTLGGWGLVLEIVIVLD